MKEQIELLKKEVEAFNQSTKQNVEEFRLQFISKKGKISALFDQLKLAAAEEKKELGKVLNELKKAAEAKFSELQQASENAAQQNAFLLAVIIRLHLRAIELLKYLSVWDLM